MTDNARIVREALGFLLNEVDYESPQEAVRATPPLLKAMLALTALETELSDLKADLERARETIMAAIPWLEEQGCDCGVDEPGTCALCLCESMLSKGERG